jgi:hypothetical protein
VLKSLALFVGALQFGLPAGQLLQLLIATVVGAPVHVKTRVVCAHAPEGKYEVQLELVWVQAALPRSGPQSLVVPPESVPAHVYVSVWAQQVSVMLSPLTLRVAGVESEHTVESRTQFGALAT